MSVIIKFDVSNPDDADFVREMFRDDDNENTVIERFLRHLPKMEGIGPKTVRMINEEIDYIRGGEMRANRLNKPIKGVEL